MPKITGLVRNWIEPQACSRSLLWDFTNHRDTAGPNEHDTHKSFEKL